MLATLVEGFMAVKSKLSEKPVAISFAFPGPADYPNGIIGDLPNLPAFRGGVALGPFLENRFYYDFDVETPFTDEDLLNIEKKMLEISQENISINQAKINTLGSRAEDTFLVAYKNNLKMNQNKINDLVEKLKAVIA